ncbi:MAG: hypothetical protein MZV63_47110 [Marinilabiliales bacterium]|nr:hypothetical protein [Marinilabiliales bacterium]
MFQGGVEEDLQRIGLVFEDHLNIKVDLSISGAEFWKGIKQNRKAGINKAKKQDSHSGSRRMRRLSNHFTGFWDQPTDGPAYHILI